MKLRPHFSIRTLAIFVTLVGAYFGAWEATNRNGLHEFPTTAYSPMPFVATFTQGVRIGNVHHIRREKRVYYLWLLGPRIKLVEYVIFSPLGDAAPTIENVVWF